MDREIEIEIQGDGMTSAWWSKETGEILEILSGKEEGPHERGYIMCKDPWILDNGLCG